MNGFYITYNAFLIFSPHFEFISRLYHTKFCFFTEFLPSPEFDIPENLWDTDAGKQIDDTADNFVVITNLQPASGYYLRLFANNDVGSSKPSPTFTILTKEEGDLTGNVADYRHFIKLIIII